MVLRRIQAVFDTTFAALALATLITATPVGELLVRSARFALGMPPRDRPLIAYFGPLADPGAADAAPVSTAVLQLAAIAQAFGSEPALVKGFVAASTRSGEVELTSAGSSLLLARGAKALELATPRGRLRAVGRVLGELGRELGSPDAGLVALVVGLDEARWAVERARAERREPVLEALLPHLSPASRPEARRVVGQALALAAAFDLGWPLPRGTPVTSKFGRRNNPFTGAPGSLHTGVDFAVPIGTAVAAAGGGRVVRAGEDGVNGRFLVVDHGRGVTSAYCHNSELLVGRAGQVEKGRTIARSGNTGRSTGPHLHYQVAIEGVPIDPLGLLEDVTVAAAQ